MPCIKRKDPQLKKKILYNSASRKEVNDANFIIKMKGDSKVVSSEN